MYIPYLHSSYVTATAICCVCFTANTADAFSSPSVLLSRKQPLSALQSQLKSQSQSLLLSNNDNSNKSYSRSYNNNNQNDINGSFRNDSDIATIMNRRGALFSIAGAGTATLASSLFVPPQAAIAATTNANTNTNTNTKFPTWTLDNNVQMPTLALNTVGLTADDTARACALATQSGFTHFDFHPGMERDGVAKFLASLKNSGAGASTSAVQREDLFLNTKIRKAKPGTSPSDAAQLAQSQIDDDLSSLNVPYVDMLMLRDSPDCDVMRAQWKVLEGALKDGKTRSIGVINYCQKSLECLLETAQVKPALNYYMLHIGMGPSVKNSASGLKAFCDSRGIKTFAYGAVGEPGPNEQILNSSLLANIGAAHGNKSTAEVALRWVLQSGAAVSVRPTTNFGLGYGVCGNNGVECEVGLKKRASALDWSLTPEEMAKLDSLAEPNDNPTLFSSAGCPGAFVMPK